MRFERTCGMVEGRAVSHIVAYDDGGKELLALPCNPIRPAQWWMGKVSRAERARLLSALARRKPEGGK